MFWMLLKFLAFVILAMLIYAYFKPNSFRIERSLTVNAAPETIHAHLADFHKWMAWSPWEGMDADMQRSYSGAASGIGAAYAWVGKKAGSGDMLITKSDPKSGIALDLNFTKPMQANNKTEITLTPDGNGTRINWAMFGAQPFMHRLFGIVFNMDKMVGKDFEKGLASLKALSEK